MNRYAKIFFAAFTIVLFTFNAATSFAAEDSQSNLPQTRAADTLISENFSGTLGPIENNPIPGWTVIDNGIQEWDETSWSRYENNAYPEYWNGDLARVLFDGVNAIGDWLISPSVDCSAEGTVNFSFKQRHSNSNSNPDTAFVLGSVDGGDTWAHQIAVYDTSIGALNDPDTAIFDISSWAAGESDVKIAFYLQGYYVLSWYIDEPTIEGDVTDTLLYEDFNGEWGPYGDNPPAGWTIINEYGPDPPNDNDWSRWYYSSWPDTVGRAYDQENDETADEWLISPTVSFSDAAICSVAFYNSYWDDNYDDTDSAMVWGSIDGGETWEHLVALYTIEDDRNTSKAESWRGFDISSWAQGQSNVKFGLHYVKDDPSYLGWWFLDDFTVYEIALLDDNIAALSVDSPSGFMITGQDYQPAATVQNLGLTQQTFDLNMTVVDPNSNEVYNETETDITLESLDMVQVDFSVMFTPDIEGDYTFTATVINPGDQDPNDDTAQTTVYAYDHQGTGGPDDFGYEFIDNTIVGGPEYNWIDITETGTQIEPTSHYFMSDGIPMGFSMEFYGEMYDSIWVNSHGELHLGSRDSWLSTNDCPLPDESTPHAPLLAVFWDRLYIHYEEGQGVYYQYFDEPDNDFFVVQWQAKLDAEKDDTLAFEAILYEDGSIIYQYQYVNDLPGGHGESATVGMEYDVLPSGLTYYCDDNNPGNRIQNGLAIKWYIPALCCDVDMTPDDDPVIVPPGGSFGLTGYIGNPTPDPIVTDVWGGVLYQDNFYRQFAFNNIPLDPGESLTAHTAQNVPNWAPQGTYGYIAYCGDRPDTKCDSAEFPFTVSGARLADGATEWSIEGGFFGEEIIPTEFSLDNAYPNPFNATTTISYQLPVASRVNLDVYNVLGQRVTTLLNGNVEAGYHNVNWDASQYSSGIYFYKLSVGDKVITKRMTLLK
ncbi:MAG: T9SS type A sorting domain-containing protein [candidate division Zixibacteria bacterium]|nr:T9SS type A sorting domain-containing protein [candidate division Zixibacteria bacterium]